MISQNNTNIEDAPDITDINLNTLDDSARPHHAASKNSTGKENSEKESQGKDISFSSGLSAFLAQLNISLAFTSYQTGRLYLIGHSHEQKLSLHEAGYSQCMGIAGDRQRLYLGTLNQVVRLENVLSPGQKANAIHDALYVPRNIQVTGNIDIHEIGIRDNGVMVFVNTQYNCLCEPDLTHSFKPIWKPKFISKIAREDRCHLNGLAMRDGQPRYVTAVCKSDVIDGWRDRRHDGGIIIDITTDEILIETLSMPHSPRWYDGKLWVLNSGRGELGFVDLEKNEFNPIGFFPGFLRGLDFHNHYAIVTLSKPRNGRFEGLELEQRLKDKEADAWAGVQIIDLNTGDIVHWIRFDGAVTELFDVCILAGVKNPLTIGLGTSDIDKLVTY